MAQYKVGTVTVTNTDATVTGSGTLWLAEIAAGDWFSLQGQGNPEYQVLSVTSNTALELTTTYAGTTESGKLYAISRDFTANYNIPILAEGDVDTHRVMARLATVVDSSIVDATTLVSYTVATLPTGVTGRMVFVTDEAGGPAAAVYNGTVWKRFYDNVTVS